ncbi:MAG TPA: sigma-70 family RNA polymerase sigma factor [Candidatus Didemnitutus sp.]|nr:sigma-70 family RNA polymerase sigma factor [Candidatus Didemnitutus sp.]
MPTSLEVSDQVAVRSVLEGDKEMFRVIVRRYNPLLYRVGVSYLRNHAQAEDAMQNAYLKAFQNLPRFQGTAAFATWLTRIMINECLMMLRREKHLRLEPDTDRLARLDRDDESPSAPDSIHAAEMKAVLEQAIQMLPRVQRTVYVLREVQHLSTAETAASLGLSAANIKVSLHRAREALKNELLKSAAGAELFSYPATLCDPMTARVMAAIAAEAE